ncbi:uncharacterized protein [Palaemon carinicauda]|uniref:uncharacterized protein isoform X2 n=1 Tax=Palaemon carinicauda TaxID=392227 RepID=UPI0035B5BECA
MESLVDKCSSGLLVAAPLHSVMYNNMLCKLDQPKSMGNRSPDPSTTAALDCSPSITPSTLNCSPSATPSFTYAISVTPTLVRPSSGTSPKAIIRSPSITPTLATSPSITPHLASSSPSVTSSSSSSSASFTCDSPKKQLLPAHGLTHEEAVKESVNYDIPGPTNAKMNQMCKVCGEPAAGFHFGAFTCEGCKSFFGRTYNNLSSLNECKNNGRCVINKKTRTSCKSCRLRKCLMVGMSKSGSRYGRRSNWFKIHYLMQNNNTTSASSTSSDLMTTNSTMTTSAMTTVTNTADAHPTRGHMSPPENMIKNSSLDYKEFKINSESSFDADYKFSSEFKSTTDSKEYHSSPTSETHNSESSLDLSEKSLFPPLSEQLYPKELLSLYNLQNLAPRLSPYVSPNSLAQRYLYPYYPSLLSVYSQKQYLNTLLQEAKHKDSASSALEDDDDEHHDRSSPDWGIPPPPKFRKSSSRSPPCRSTPEWHSAATDAILRGILPFHHKIPVDDNLLAHSSDHNAGHDFLSQEESDLVPVGATAPQDLPIDLSMKNKFSAYSLHKIINLGHSMCKTGGMNNEENIEEMSGEKENEREAQTKTEQDVPLDLSYIGS